MYDFYHEYYECLSSQLTQSSPTSGVNILSNIQKYLSHTVFILPLYASRYTQNTQRHEHHHLRIIFQGRKTAAVRREGRACHYSISFLKYSASLPPNKRRASVRSRRIWIHRLRFGRARICITSP